MQHSIGGGPMMVDRAVSIEVRGLRVEAHIGVSDAEREVERPIEIDLFLALPDASATETDELADTVDYAALAALASEIARSQPHRTLERLAARIADSILERFGAERVEVRVAKPDPPMAERVDRVAVTVRRPAE